MFPLTFDWAQIAYIGSPLLTPWWAAANIVTGLVVVIWVAAPILCKVSPILSRLTLLTSADQTKIIKMFFSLHICP